MDRPIPGDLLRAELIPYGDDRFQLVGADLTLAPKTALALGMVFHELATNAAKYGARSAMTLTAKVQGPAGGWATTCSHHVLTPGLDQSPGGPQVKLPECQGFGTRLIERSLKGELGGDAVLNYQEEGFQCSLKAPLEPLNA